MLERHFGLNALDEGAIPYLRSRPFDAWQEFSFLYTNQYADNFRTLNAESLVKRAGELSPYLHARRDAIKTGAAVRGLRKRSSLFGTIAANALVPQGGMAVSLLGAFLGGGAGFGIDALKHFTGAKRREALVRLYSIFDAS